MSALANVVNCQSCGSPIAAADLLIWPDFVGSAICHTCLQVVLVHLDPPREMNHPA